MTIPTERHRQNADPGSHVCVPAPSPSFEPRNTIRCIGHPVFKSLTARDVGCLLDVDPEVVSWTAGDGPAVVGAEQIAYDLKVTYPNRIELIVVIGDDGPPPGAAADVAERADFRLKFLGPDDIAGDRLENARELLRYARWTVSLSDRVRLLTVLEQEGSLPLAECLSAVRSGRDPIASIAALCLHRFVEIDLDSGRIGPQTRVAPFRG